MSITSYNWIVVHEGMSSDGNLGTPRWEILWHRFFRSKIIAKVAYWWVSRRAGPEDQVSITSVVKRPDAIGAYR